MREPFYNFIQSDLKGKFLLIACGLPGTWKTETTEEVARIKECPMLRSDIIRLEVLKNEDVFDEKVASNMDKRMMVYEEMFRQAERITGKGSGVILDATFVTQELRKRAAAIADKHNLLFVILQTDCPQEVSISRILQRNRDEYVSNALTEQAYINNKKSFEAVDISDIKTFYPSLNIFHLVVDTSKDPPEDWYIINTDKR